MHHSDQELDARGLNCPLPILQTKKIISGMKSGEVLKVLATDPGAVKDMAAYCNQTGNQLLQTEQSANDTLFYIRKTQAHRLWQRD